jgi:hypothetical protein
MRGRSALPLALAVCTFLSGHSHLWLGRRVDKPPRRCNARVDVRIRGPWRRHTPAPKRPDAYDPRQRAHADPHHRSPTEDGASAPEDERSPGTPSTTGAFGSALSLPLARVDPFPPSAAAHSAPSTPLCRIGPWAPPKPSSKPGSPPRHGCDASRATRTRYARHLAGSPHASLIPFESTSHRSARL